MGFAVRVQYRCFRVVSKANRAVLVGYASERDSLSDIQISPKQPLMTLVAMHRTICLLHGLLQFSLQPLVSLQVVRRIGQDDLAVTADGDPIVRRSEEHTSELQSHLNLVCRLLLEKKKKHIS